MISLDKCDEGGSMASLLDHAFTNIETIQQICPDVMEPVILAGVLLVHERRRIAYSEEKTTK